MFHRQHISVRKRVGERAYTLSELIVVLAILGMLSMIAVPVYSGVRRATLQSAAVHNAKLVNAARDSYALTIPSAATRWTDAASDEARLQLLVSENLLSGASIDYLAMAGGYSVEVSGALRTKTVLKQEGHALAY